MVLNKGPFAGALILASLIGTTAGPAQAAYTRNVFGDRKRRDRQR